MDKEEMPDHSELMDLLVTQQETEANLVRGILEESGIHCILLSQVPHNIYPFTVDGLATIRVQVLDSQLEAARAILQEHEETSGTDLDDNPQGANGE